MSDLIKLAEALESVEKRIPGATERLDMALVSFVMSGLANPVFEEGCVLGYRAAMEQQRDNEDRATYRGKTYTPEEVVEKMAEVAREKNKTIEALQARIQELEQQLLYAEDAAEKGRLARETAGGMEMRIQELESLGTVYIYPEGWNSFKMGGAPSIEDYEEIHLPDYGRGP